MQQALHERKRREEALADRLDHVNSEKSRQRHELRESRAALRIENAELDAAMS